MGARQIDRDSAVPYYQQLADILREQITSGELAGKLSSQTRLATQYGVNPLTVRKALALLRDEGLVVTYLGSGSQVVPPPEG
jgi:DNA-binding GntR family transcriptional regulator